MNKKKKVRTIGDVIKKLAKETEKREKEEEQIEIEEYLKSHKK